MANDGAHYGLDVGQSFDVVCGEAVPEQRRDPVQMRDWLLAAQPPPLTAEQTYEGYVEYSRYAGKLVLEEFLSTPASAKYGEDMLYVLLHEKLESLDLTGFMWGWAVNAARYCVELPPIQNPAILEIQSGG